MTGMAECTECGEEVDADDVACRECGAHQWHRRATEAPRPAAAVSERPVGRRGGDAGSPARSGLSGLRDRWRTDRSTVAPGRGASLREPRRESPPRTDTPMLRATPRSDRSARARERRRSAITAISVTVVAPLCLGLGVVAFGEAVAGRAAPGPTGPEWVLVLETVPKSRVSAAEFARGYRGADVVIADGDDHPGLHPGTYAAIPRQAYASERQAAADCGAYGRTEGAHCRPVRVR